MSDQDLLRLGELLDKLQRSNVPKALTSVKHDNDAAPTYTLKKIRNMERTKERKEKDVSDLNAAVRSSVQSGLAAYQSTKEMESETREEEDQEETLSLFLSLLQSSLDLRNLIESNPFSNSKSEVPADVQAAFWEEVCRRSEDEITNVNISEMPQTLANYLTLFVKLATLQSDKFDIQSSIRTMERFLKMILEHPNFDEGACKSTLVTVYEKLREFAQEIGSFDRYQKYSNALGQLSGDLPRGGHIVHAAEHELSQNEEEEEEEEEDYESSTYDQDDMLTELPPPLAHAFIQAEEFEDFEPFDILLDQFRQGHISRDNFLVHHPRTLRTPIILFAANNRLDLIDRLLLGTGPRTLTKVLIEDVDAKQKNALFYAASKAYYHIVEDFLFRLGITRFQPASISFSVLNIPDDAHASLPDVSKALLASFLQDPQLFIRVAYMRRGLHFEGPNILTTSISHVPAPPLELPEPVAAPLNPKTDTQADVQAGKQEDQAKELQKDTTTRGKSNPWTRSSGGRAKKQGNEKPAQSNEGSDGAAKMTKDVDRKRQYGNRNRRGRGGKHGARNPRKDTPAK